MKKYSYIFVLFFSIFSISSYAQQNHRIPEFHIYDLDTKKSVEKVPIFPECNVVMSNNQLLECLRENLSNIFLYYLEMDFPETNKDKLNVVLKFVISDRGEIEDIAYHEGDKELTEQAIEAMKKTAKHLKDNDLEIEPAVMKSGKPVDVMYYMPVSLSKES